MVKQTNFEDAQNTWNNSPALLGPPTVEFAPYGRIASGRRRIDTKQGTIDQDPEFMDFLESLANPVSIKDITGDGAVEFTEKIEKVTTTPLVQYLKDKKANKTKEAAAIKAAKQAKLDSSGKTSSKSSKEGGSEDSKRSAKDLKKEKLVEKAAREAVKVLNREASGKVAGAQGSAAEPPKNPRVPRERGSIAAAARILQRDLGLSPGNAHRKAKSDAEIAAKAAGESSTSSKVNGTPNPRGQVTIKGRGSRSAEEAGKFPPTSKDTAVQSSHIVLLRKPAEVAPAAASTLTPTPPSAPTNVSKQASTPPAPTRKPQPVAVPTAGATKAFVKHANPSQGVTEALLKEAMETFGAVSHVEIDKRKGFAYVDFVEHEGLLKAMAANPTKIAQGTVQVLERKDARPAREPPAGPSGRGGFGRGGGRGGQRGQRGARGGGGGRSSDGSTSNAPASAPTGPANAK